MFKLPSLPFGKKQQAPNKQSAPTASVGAHQQTPAQQSVLQSQIQSLSQGLLGVKDIIAPSAVETDFNYLKIGDHYVQTLFVAGYPRFVSPNWLAPLISLNHSLEVAMFIYPQESKEILDNLRRKVGEMEATIQSDVQRGHIVEPSVQVALEDALVLQQQLAKGAERFYQFGLYITIPADTVDELTQISKQVQSMLASLLIMAKPATLQMEEGFKSTLPFCSDRLLITRNMDTTSLATTFPFTTSELTANAGIMYGINEHNDSLVIFDRFSLENANSVVFGKSIAAWDTVLIRENGIISTQKIGNTVERLIQNNGITHHDEELEGVKNPDIEVFSYDKNLKGKWCSVSIAARKSFSKRENLYHIITKSGREITVTADHSMITLKNGRVCAVAGQSIKIGEAVPVPRALPEPITEAAPIIPNQCINDWPVDLPQTIPWGDELLHLLGLTTSEGYCDHRMLTVFNHDDFVLDIIKKSAAKIGARVGARWKIDKQEKKQLIAYNIQPGVYARLFCALGAGGKSGDKRVPPMIFTLKNNQVAAYLRAYFEGDGTVSQAEASCTSKSKQLIFDIAYLLLRFGIIARIKPTFKRATNTKHTGETYYKLRISGNKHLKLFAKHVGFLSQRKTKKLQKITTKTYNTNVDTIPTLEPLLNQLYAMLYQGDGIKTPANFSPLKRGVFEPSPQQLQILLKAVKNRINELRHIRDNIVFLNQLPDFDTLITRGAKNKKLNRALWNELGYSWQLMKQKKVTPGTVNVLRVHKTVTGETIVLQEIKNVLYETFNICGVSLQRYNKGLWTSITQESRKSGDTLYPTLFEAVVMIKKKYRSLQLTIRHAEAIIKYLRKLAISDLFWDPIVSIKKISHQEKYVYDLTVDNEVFVAGQGGIFVHNSGSGKSFMVKLEILRSLMFDTEVIVIDPENEYGALTKAASGEYINFSFHSDAKINPFDLSQVATEGENELGLKILSLHGLFRVIMGKLTPEEDALLDRALVLTYKQKGITPDPKTQTKEPPLMEDLYKTLVGMEDPRARGLADRIEKFIKGSLTGIFNQQSNVNIKNPLTVFSVRDLTGELRPVAIYIILDYIWTRIKRDLKKRILVVDEAWYLMQHPDSAQFLNSIAKRARKYYLGLTTITQDVEDFLSVDLGKTIIQNSSLQTLMKQSTAAVDKLAQVFYLSEGEKHLLLSADVGEGLFFAGPSHVAIRVIASPDEHKLATTNPKEVAAQKTATQPSHSTPSPTLPTQPVQVPSVQPPPVQQPIQPAVTPTNQPIPPAFIRPQPQQPVAAV